MQQHIDKLFKLICLLVHPPSFQKQSKALHTIITIYNKIQELEMIIDPNQQYGLYMSTISQVISYCFGINIIGNNYIAGISIIFLLLHALFFLLTISFISKNNITLQTTLHNFLVNYLLIFYIPTMYTSFIIILETTFFDNLTGSQYQIVFRLISVINIFFALIICFIHIYFARCEKLMEDNNILKLDQSIQYTAIQQLALLCSIILRVAHTQQTIRLILLLTKYIIYIITSIKSVNEKQYVIIDCISAILSIVIVSNISIFEACLLSLFFIAIVNQLQNILIVSYITTSNQLNIVTSQIIEKCLYDNSNIKNKIILSLIHCNFRIIYKSKYNRFDMNNFLLRKMANLTNSNKLNKHVLIYCYYISNNAPLKGLIKLISVKTNSAYYKAAYYNLSQELNQRTKQFQAEANYKFGRRNKNEHFTQLDTELVYFTSHSSSDLFPIIIEAIQAKIKFWNRLINGYTTIENLLQETLITTEKMLKCKQSFENRFDMISNKLRNSITSDVLSMRILQIFYSGVYTNSFQAYTLEKSIEDLLKSERYKQEEALDNIKLAQNRMIILKTSYVKRRGELLDVNVKQLSQFLNEKEEIVKGINHCSQLMPKFLANIHDSLMENYTSNQFTKLMIRGESTFYQNLQGFLEPCSINLYNFYDGKDDFLLNMILSKESNNYETILFGIDGKILGFTKSFYEQALQETASKTLKSSQGLDIQQFLQKNPLIPFYIPQILIQIDELRAQILSSQNYQINNLKSLWIIPENHIDCLLSTQLILQQFKKKSQASISQNLQSYKSQTYSRYSQKSVISETDNYDSKDFTNEIKKAIQIEDTFLLILHQDYQEYIKKLLKENINPLQQLEIQYSLQYKTLKFKKDSFGYFMLSIKEFKPQNMSMSQGLKPISGQTNVSTDPLPLSKSELLYPQQLISEKPGSDIKSEQSSEIIQEIKQITNLYQNEVYFQDSNNNSANRSNINSFSNSKLILQQLKSSERILENDQLIIPQPTATQNTKRCNSNLFLQSQFTVQPLYIRPKLFDQQIVKEFNEMENEMNQIDQQRQVVLDDLDQGEEAKLESNSKSEQKKSKSSILEKFKKTQVLNNKNIEGADFHSNPSRTSTSSTSKEALSIVQQLYDDSTLIVPLKKISFILTITCFGILLINIINVIAIDSNLQNQVTQIENVRKPLNINLFYVATIFQLFTQHLTQLGLLDTSPFMKQRTNEQLNYFYEYGRSIMQDHIVDVPILAELIDITTVEVKVVENNKRYTVDTSLHQFYSILYENSEEIYRRNLNCTSNCSFSEILASGYLRQNLVVMMGFHDSLIDSISANTIATQNQVRSNFLQIMLAEIFSILFLVGIQLKIWIFLDHITKSILFLVSRLNEIQSIEQISKLNTIKLLLEEENNNKWKLQNFSEQMFEINLKKTKRITSQKISEKEKQIYKSTTALYSRIQRTYYINRTNVLITFLIAIIWPLYLMSGYLIHMQNNDNFQPSLSVTLQMVRYRQNFDGSVILGGIIKGENLLPKNDLSFINQTFIINQFISLKDNLSPIINEMASVVLEAANQNNEKSRFDDLLNNDLCISCNSSILAMCDPDSLQQSYYNKDDYRTIIKNGALGFTAAFLKFINQDYNFEMTTMAYDTKQEDNKESINSQQYNNFLIQFTTDIINCMRNFLVLLQENNSAIAQSIVSIVQSYYLGFGICLFLSLCLLSFIWIYKAQQKMNSLRQILVLIPLELILTANIRSQAKEIHSLLF